MTNRLKNKKIGKQKGYIIILSLLFSVLSLSFSILYYGIINEAHQKRKTSNLIEDTAAYIVQFSNAVNESYRGFGPPEAKVLTVDLLKKQELLNDGFPENIGLGQTLKAYYAGNPENPDIIDYIVVLEGEASDAQLEELGITRNIMNRFNKEIAQGVERRGVDISANSRSYTIGTFNENQTQMRSRSNEIVETEHFSLTDNSHVGVYTYAPNQVGWWRFQVSPYNFSLRGNEFSRIQYINQMSSLRLVHSTIRNSDIINEGFSLECPSDYQKITMENKNFTLPMQSNLEGSGAIKFCIETYESSVDLGLENHRNIQIEGAFSSRSPNPVAGNPSTWGNCYAGINNFYTKGLGVPEIDSVCANQSDFKYKIFNTDSRADIRPVEFNTYNSIVRRNSSSLKDNYEMSFRDSNDFKIPVVFIGNTLSIKVDDRYVRMLLHTSEFVSANPANGEYVISGDKTNELSGFQMVVQDFPFSSNMDYVTQTYTTYNGNKETIDTVYEYKNNY